MPNPLKPFLFVINFKNKTIVYKVNGKFLCVLSTKINDGMEKELTRLIIEEEKCIGCGICVVVCDENRMNEEVIYGKGGRYKDELVLEVEEGKAKLVDAKKCKRAFEPPDFCRACVDHCPTSAMDLV
ncbi:4Fe-4S dicluster domain-containing protein [Methanophagales archaeon]|nr:MAG: 4Fe-4S dicluster domain-containing protein [Methanophagales archaeon]